MAYPSLPTSNYLGPASTGTDSGSSVEPLTPDLPGMDNDNHTTFKSHRDSISGRRSSNISTGGEDSIDCKWKSCEYVAFTPDALYEHLCNVHIGRKSTNNLCLTCGWENCGVTCIKRDHITSHLRVHTPLKPHPCAVCGKTFKRPQDLKKHERIHTQEHHQVHKLSKAATTSDPDFNSRVIAQNGDRRLSGSLDIPRSPASMSLSPSSSSSRSQLNPSSPYDRLLPPLGHSSVSPNPSSLAALHRKQAEELFAYQQREWMVLQQLGLQQQQNQAMAAQLANEGMVKAGSKRGQEHEDDMESFDRFLADMKKRKVEPVYNADMMQRLNNLVAPALPTGFPQMNNNSLGSFNNNSFNNGFQNNYPSLPNFNAQQIPSVPQLPLPELKTEADLALFNQFMISLGRDTSGQMPQSNGYSMDHSLSGSGTGSPLSDGSAVEDLFNPEELASLGLAGLPGIPSSNSGANLSSSLPPPQSNISFGGMYPTLDTFVPQRQRSESDLSKRTIAGLPRMNQSIPQRAPALSNIYGLGATQFAETPQMHHDYSSNFASFDSLDQRTRHSLPEATMAPRDFYKKTYRHVAPLGAAMSSRLRESSERTEFADDDIEEIEVDETEDLDDDSASTPRMSVRALLLPDDQADPALKLPAILGNVAHDHGDLPSLMDRRGSGQTTRSSSISDQSHGSRPVSPPARQLPVKRHTDDSLVRDVKRLELGSGEYVEPMSSRSSPLVTSMTIPEERPSTANGVQMTMGVISEADREKLRELRKKHATLIRDWLVAVNLEWRRRESEKMNVKIEEEEVSPRDVRRLALEEIAA